MKSYAKSWIVKSILIVVLVGLDLLSKYLLQQYFENGGEPIVVINNFFNLEYVQNTGVAFGMFKNSVVASLVFPIIFLLAFVAYDILCKTNKKTYIVAFSLIIAGAIGNLYDRIILKFVRDFFAVKIFPFVFNFADACVSIGFVMLVVVFILDIIKSDKQKKNNVKIKNENKTVESNENSELNDQNDQK